MRDGSVLSGKVIVIKSDVVTFTENATSLSYELRKSEIASILLSSGKSLSFSDETSTGVSVIGVLAFVGALFLIGFVSKAAH